MAYEDAVQAMNSAIEDYMSEQGLSRTDMASRLGMSVQSFYNKTSGKYEWKWSEVLELSRLTGKSVDALIGLKEVQVG